MKRPVLIAIALCAVSLGGCASKPKIKKIHPVCAQDASTPVGAQLLHAQKIQTGGPAAKLGAYLDAAAEAAAQLWRQPGNDALRHDYNFAVERIFQVIHESKLTPWNGGLTVPGAQGPWTLYTRVDGRRPERDPANYDLVPVDTCRLWGEYEEHRAIRKGIGGALVANSRVQDATKIDRFSQGKNIHYGVTALIHFEGRRARVEFRDPLAEERVTYAGHSFPLSADFSAPLAFALAEDDTDMLGLPRLLRPEKYADTARIARLEPYDPKKIPVLMVHGLMSSPYTWMPLINGLRANEEFRRRYQVWHYSYPSGYPYPLSAAILREKMDEIRKRYPDHKQLVVIGHSMGGVISRTLLLNSGLKLWHAYFPKPPEHTRVSDDTGRKLREMLILEPRKDIARVIFVCAPHRGADMAAGWIGRLGSKLIKLPGQLWNFSTATALTTVNNPGMLRIGQLPNSVDTLSPNNRYVIEVNKLPLPRDIPFHTIAGDRGKGGNRDKTKPILSDGLVPYWSAHLEGARSERVIPSGHSGHEHPDGIAEIRRILGVEGAR